VIAAIRRTVFYGTQMPFFEYSHDKDRARRPTGMHDDRAIRRQASEPAASGHVFAGVSKPPAGKMRWKLNIIIMTPRVWAWLDPTAKIFTS
jgi:hypothetical protein